jgi:hypothetical protein
MTNANLLCEFLTNPFGDEQKARELLSEIDNRPVSDAELERGLFCFQIVFYFLACLALTAHIEDSSLQKKSIDELNDRVRAFYARRELQAHVSEFIVTPAERDRFIAVLRQQLDQLDGTRVEVTPPATTMLALFDFVVVPVFAHTLMRSKNRNVRVNFASSRNRSFFIMLLKSIALLRSRSSRTSWQSTTTSYPQSLFPARARSTRRRPKTKMLLCPCRSLQGCPT